MNRSLVIRRVARIASGCMALTCLHSGGVLADRDGRAHSDLQMQIQRGFEINPVPLNLRGKNRDLVGLGSYIVNTSGCNDCHTHPSYLPDHDPFDKQPEMINVPQYLAGGRQFPPLPSESPNITPDENGDPAGLTYEEFLSTLRTGHNPLDRPGSVLQVMPWPTFGKKTEKDLRAIYEYLSAIPSLPDNPNPGP